MSLLKHECALSEKLMLKEIILAFNFLFHLFKFNFLIKFYFLKIKKKSKKSQPKAHLHFGSSVIVKLQVNANSSPKSLKNT